ncbi:hypothetical protein NitYY0826_C1347 [Nitratiruptor sp. YY08-26]|uniref:trimeric intracellular cation channel family protein n=1 Tax=unclassified Nitratiruptor TaxID=2624044 RepID=UPI001914E523|nr:MULTISPECIES: TRIC cation channel family protein [unclassified Nitratiruptor]BCD62471.1 hypothetical protein NitYY0813_C1345 [Nitratiruptor sp. YY08-13]BCD66407.1 hypothetical protein NitYY0826_C1347 [Nitratiruptor sp. YY08-26]
MSILEITDYIGIIAFALSGYWVAAQHKLDILGAFIVAFLTALGGGVIRDILTGATPYAFTHTLPAAIVIGVVASAYLLRLQRFFDYQKKLIFLLSDGLGLVSFSISGAMAALSAQFNFFGVMLVALITAVGGGVVRDILLNEIPFILRTGFYGTIAILTGAFIFLFNEIEFLNPYTVTLLFLFSLFLRLWAIFGKWSLPKL